MGNSPNLAFDANPYLLLVVSIFCLFEPNTGGELESFLFMSSCIDMLLMQPGVTLFAKIYFERLPSMVKPRKVIDEKSFSDDLCILFSFLFIFLRREECNPQNKYQ